ncbi:MAG: alpha/beta hydrolase [Fimbriimonadaceae bacterium]
MAERVAPGFGILSPRGRVVENGANRFFRRIAEGVFDLEDLRKRAADLAAFVAEAADGYGFDPKQVWALGYSNGANMAAALMILHPGTLAGGFLLRPMIPIQPDAPPDLKGVRVGLSAGTHDPITPSVYAERLVEYLERLGASVEATWLEAGHGLTREDVETAARFFSPTAR